MEMPYAEKEALAYSARFIKAGDGILQYWRTYKDNEEHCERLLNFIYEHGKIEPSCRRILDLGCGTGEFLFHVMNLWPDADVTGINLFDSQKIFAHELVKPHIRIGDIRDDEFLESFKYPYDAVFASYVVGHLTLPEYFKALSKLVSPGGRVIQWDIRRPTPYSEKVIFGYTMYDPIEVYTEAKKHGFSFRAIPWNGSVVGKGPKAVLSQEDRRMFEENTRPVLYWGCRDGHSGQD
jgi:cyclopropane fatty-acyl-phospholipid synthase-like methyltransferase